MLLVDDDDDDDELLEGLLQSRVTATFDIRSEEREKAIYDEF